MLLKILIYPITKDTFHKNLKSRLTFNHFDGESIQVSLSSHCFIKRFIKSFHFFYINKNSIETNKLVE